MGHCRFAQAIVKMGNAEVWGVAALSERPAQGNSTAGGRWCTTEPPDVSLRGGRRPTWRPEREARGSALGVQSRSTRLHRGKVTGEIATAFPRLPRLLRSLAMTNLAACCIRRDAVTSLQAPSSRVIAGREAPLALPLGELSPKVTERALQALPISSGHR